MSCGVERYVALYSGGYLNPQDGGWYRMIVKGLDSMGSGSTSSLSSWLLVLNTSMIGGVACIGRLEIKD